MLFGVPQFGAATLPPGAWVWPVLRHPDGRPPKISSGWGSERAATEAQDAHSHIGVDIMYRRPAEVPSSVYKPEHGSPYYEAPKGTLILAAHDGVVWSTGSGLLGKKIVIDHGPLPYATYYQHLEQVFVLKGQRVVAGQVIGVMGHGTIGSIRHLHFEVWKGGRDAAFDPQKWMESSWVVLNQPTVGLTSGAAFANFKTSFKRPGVAIAGAGLLAVGLIAGAFAWRQHQER